MPYGYRNIYKLSQKLDGNQISMKMICLFTLREKCPFSGCIFLIWRGPFFTFSARFSSLIFSFITFPYPHFRSFAGAGRWIGFGLRKIWWIFRISVYITVPHQGKHKSFVFSEAVRCHFVMLWCRFIGKTIRLWKY